MTNILLTGASGQIGQAIQRHFPPECGATLLLTSRHKEALSDRQRYFDFADLPGSEAALQEADILFLLRPPQLADVDTYFRPLVEACGRTGIQHILFLSVQGADQASFIPHAKIERLLGESGIPYTFFRPSYFMQNLSTTLHKEIVQHDRIFLPSGKKPFLWVDVDDIGAAIARVLAEADRHRGKIYTLTGPDLLSFREVARILSEELGRTIRYQSPNLLRFVWYRRRLGDDWGYIMVLILLHYLARFQPVPEQHDDLVLLTQKKPHSLRAYIRANRMTWKREEG